MPLCQVSWVAKDGTILKGLLVQFVSEYEHRTGVTKTQAMVMRNKAFWQVPYEDLTFERWMD